MAAPATLWRHRDFMLLWIGQSVSVFGNQFTALALPIIAILALGAGAAEMGILGAAGTAAFPLIGLFVGVWVDRHRRRPVLIAGDLGRGIIVGVVALLAFASLLQMWILYVLSFLTGVLTVFFDVAYMAYLPSLVSRRQLVEGNSKLETTNSLSAVAGPGLAGAVIRILSVGWAMVFDAFSFFFAAAMMTGIRTPETVTSPADRKHVWAEMREGLAVVFRDRRLWSIAGCTATANLFANATFAILFLYAKSDLGFTDETLAPAFGVIFSVGAIGGLLGAVTAGRLARRLGIGATIVLGSLIGGVAAVGILFATPATAFVVLVGTFALLNFSILVYNINQVSLRQALVPVRLQGRLNATMRFLVWGTVPLGSLLGGILGVVIGLRATVVVTVIGGLFAFAWVLFSPVRSLREMPAPSE